MRVQSPDSIAEGVFPEGDIWTTGESSSVSYPEAGNASCFELEDGSYWFQHRNDCIHALLSVVGVPARLLDVGGGNGFVARRLNEAGIDTMVLEPGLTGAINARRRRGIGTVIHGTLASARFRSGAIPSIGIFDVLEHQDDDRAFLGECRRVLSAGGLLAGTVPAYDALWSASDVFAGHRRRYSPARLRALLERDFEILYLSCIFRPLLPAVLLGRTAPYWFGMRSRTPISEMREHSGGTGALSRIVRRLLASEVDMVLAGGSMRWGTSILFAARAKGCNWSGDGPSGVGVNGGALG